MNDEGVDTDDNGKFNYLQVSVEVKVTTAGYYSISLSGLKDSSDNHISVYDSKYLFLATGVQNVSYLTVNGENIYSSIRNPSKVSDIYVYDEKGDWLESMYDVALSRVYAYTEFDPPPVYLTGIIYDEGIDIDGNGKFDYLKIIVQVYAEEEHQCQVYVSGLEAGHGYVSVYEYNISKLEVGTNLISVNLYSPTIHLSGVNPTQVSSIILYESDVFLSRWWGSLSNIALSRRYFYFEFDHPFADTEASFTVYPDGRVVMGGTLDYRPLPYPFSSGLDIFADIGFTREDGSTQVSADFAFIAQQQIAGLFPFKDSSFDLAETYSGRMANMELTGRTMFPPSLASQYPLNLSDFTVTADYSENSIVGTITIPLISGIPIATINVDFQGNLTDLHLSDDLEIFYGTFFGSGINETIVENMLSQLNSTILGTGSGSLYQATNGILECTSLNTSMIKKTGGATITFDAHVHGDFVQFFVFAMRGGNRNPGLYWFANAFVSSIEKGHFELSYAKAYGEASMQLTFTANFTKLRSLLQSTLPTENPQEQRAPIELLLNTTLCSVDSALISWTYADGRSDLHLDATIGPDLNAEINFIKNLAITYGNPYPLSIWQFINNTEIDLSNLNVALNLTKTSLFCKIDGFQIKSATDSAADPTQFKLERLFNMTYSPYGEPPTKYSRLKITVEGGYNSTHTVTLVRPSGVPSPNITVSDQTSMIWLNQSVSGLKDLIFDIKYQGIFEWKPKVYRVIFDSNSRLGNFNFNLEQKQFSFRATGESGTLGFCNISVPRELLYSPPEGWVITLDEGPPLQYLTQYNVTETGTHTFIYFTYRHSVHNIVVRGFEVIYEFDASMLLTLLLVSTVSLAVINRTVNKRKEKSAAETSKIALSHAY